MSRRGDDPGPRPGEGGNVSAGVLAVVDPHGASTREWLRRSDHHNALLRPLLLAPALALGLHHQFAYWAWLAVAALAAAASVLLGTLGAKYWARFYRLRAQFFLDVIMVVCISMVGMGVVHLPEMAALNFLLPLLIATTTGTQLRFAEVVAAAVAITGAWVLSSQYFGVLSPASALTLALFNSVLVWGWWNRPLRLYQARAVRLYAHDFRGFLSTLLWSLQLDDPAMMSLVKESIQEKIEANRKLEVLLSSISKRRRPRCFDAAPLIRSVLGVESDSPLPVRASAENFVLSLVSISLAAPTPPNSITRDARTLHVSWTVDSRDFVVRNAALITSQTLDLPHRAVLSSNRLELRVRLHRHRGPLHAAGDILTQAPISPSP